MPQILKNNRFLKILIFKTNQIEIKNNQNIWWSAILCFGKPLKTIIAIFISKWINYSRNIVSNDLKGFLQGIWACKQDYKDTRIQDYKISRIQRYKDFILIYFAVSLDMLSSLRYFLFRIEPQVWHASAHREVSWKELEQ